jgi:hypothetical protein
MWRPESRSGAADKGLKKGEGAGKSDPLHKFLNPGTLTADWANATRRTLVNPNRGGSECGG